MVVVWLANVLIFLNTRETNLLHVLLILFAHGLNIFLYKVRYFNRLFIYCIVKVVELFTVTLLILAVNRYTSSAGAILYLLLCIEMFIIIDVSTNHMRRLLLLIAISPLFIHMLALLKHNFFTWAPILLISEIIVILISSYDIFHMNLEELNQQLFEKTRLLDESKATNEALLKTQEDLKKVNLLLAEQKLELQQAYNKVNKFSSEMYIQIELLKYISSVLNIDELLELVTDSIIGAIGVDTCSLAIYDISKDKYLFKVKSIYSTDYTNDFKTLFRKGKLDKFLTMKTPKIDNHVQSGAYDFIMDRHVGSLIIFPLTQDDQIHGLLIAEHLTKDMFQSNNIQFLQGIVAQIKIAVKNASLYAKLEDMARRDGLTGVFNKAHLENVLTDYYHQIEQGKLEQLAVAIFDIDLFKKFNDNYGHLFGDEAIKATAHIGHEVATAHGGLITRFGGEEFVLVFPNKTLDIAVEIMTLLHNKIKSNTLYFNTHEEVSLDVSIGLTVYPELCTSPKELLRRADKAMYYSKQNGRGRLTIDQPNSTAS